MAELSRLCMRCFASGSEAIKRVGHRCVTECARCGGPQTVTIVRLDRRGSLSEGDDCAHCRAVQKGKVQRAANHN